MKRIITYGTFDCFHIGHLRLLEKAASLGDSLYVGVSTDNFNALKGKKALIPYEDRLEIVSSIKHVHTVFAEEDWDQKIDDIKKYNIDMFVIGDDWTGHFDKMLKALCEVRYLPRTNGISSTSIREQISAC